MDQDLRTVVRDAATAARKRWLDPDDPCGTSMIRDLNERDFIADAVAVAVLKHKREEIGKRADRCRAEAFQALWHELDQLDCDIDEFVSEGGVPAPSDSVGRTPEWRENAFAGIPIEGSSPLPVEPPAPSEPLPISKGDVIAVLRQLLAETEMLHEQEQCRVDGLRMQALRVAITRLGSASPTPKIWDCRVCGFGVREGAALDWICAHGEHDNVAGERVPNKGTAYCPQCNDETLRSPLPVAPPAPSELALTYVSTCRFCLGQGRVDHTTCPYCGSFGSSLPVEPPAPSEPKYPADRDDSALAVRVAANNIQHRFMYGLEGDEGHEAPTLKGDTALIDALISAVRAETRSPLPVEQQEGRQHEQEKDDGGTSLTEDDGVSVLVPASTASHDATEDTCGCGHVASLHRDGDCYGQHDDRYEDKRGCYCTGFWRRGPSGPRIDDKPVVPAPERPQD